MHHGQFLLIHINMKRQSFAGDRSGNSIPSRDSWIEWLWILGLFAVALLLFTTALGTVALRDWDEGTVAQVAKEIWQAPPGSFRWLFPTQWGEPYLNKPPLVHGLIAIAYSLGGVNEWTTRLPGALLMAFSVPLLYGVGKEVFPARLPALFSALIYLTLLPVVRHGRLAMLDGAVLCFEILMFWCALRSRRDLRWSLGIGLAFALIGLTKGMMGVLLGAIALIFLAWDTPRLLTSLYFWGGVSLGSLPVIGWYAAQWIHYDQQFTETGIFQQSLHRIWQPVDQHQGPPWYYVFEILKYSFPWLIFSLYGLQLAKDNINWSWAKLVLVWSGVYFVVVSVMITKLPWYIMPIYPALALAGGAKLGEVWQWPPSRPYPRAWMVLLGFLAAIAGIACLVFSIIEPSNASLILILGSVALTMGIAAVLVQQRDSQFILILFWGMYVSLILLMTSQNWLWELNEAYPVKPVALVIQKTVPTEATVYTSFGYERPSLNFYSDRRIIPISNSQLQEIWHQEDRPYFLITEELFEQMQGESVKKVGTASPNWVLITKD